VIEVTHECGEVLELLDTMDANPPIPYSAWPDRWHVHNGEGGSLSVCPGCEEWLEPEELAAAAGLERDYPWNLVLSHADADALAESICPRCEGSGEISWNPSRGGDPQAVVSMVCGRCGGSGSLDT
jgi:hypothetical protein